MTLLPSKKECKSLSLDVRLGFSRHHNFHNENPNNIMIKVYDSFFKAIVSTIYLMILFIQFRRLYHNSYIENLFCEILHRHFQAMRCLNIQKALKIKCNRPFNLFFSVNVIQFLSDPNV